MFQEFLPLAQLPLVHTGAAGKGAAIAADDRDLRLRVEIEAAQRIQPPAPPRTCRNTSPRRIVSRHFAGNSGLDDDARLVGVLAFRPKPIREPEEILLEDRAQHCSRGPLDDLVLESGDRKRALAAVFPRNVAPTGRQCPVCSPFDPRVQVLDPAFLCQIAG